jgi:hypothetical protein
MLSHRTSHITRASSVLAVELIEHLPAPTQLLLSYASCTTRPLAVFIHVLHHLLSGPAYAWQSHGRLPGLIRSADASAPHRQITYELPGRLHHHFFLQTLHTSIEQHIVRLHDAYCKATFGLCVRVCLHCGCQIKYRGLPQDYYLHCCGVRSLPPTV